MRSHFVFLGFAVAVGAALPVACGANADGPQDASGTGGSGLAAVMSASTGSGGAMTDGGYFDVSPNDDDPPPFTGESYARYCGDLSACTPGVAAGCGGGSQGGGPAATGCKLVVDLDGGPQGPIDGGDGGFATPISSACAPQTGGQDNDPCITSADCGIGQGCVGKPPGGLCHIYCCDESLDSCPTGTWCVPQRMAEDPNVRIPACVPASGCTLLDDADTCADGLTCAVVRSDGPTASTSCVQAGTNTEGQPCPCAAGFQCSRLANVCLKLCHVGANNECGSDGAQCQGGSNSYPEGIGTCVGGTMHRP